jgi:hypothetical protein
VSRAVATALALAAIAALTAGCGDDAASPDEREQAIAAARDAYAEVSARAVDLDSGPCIAERLDDLPDWVVDVAHDPRQPVDDVGANQCRRFRDGEASHFVELTPTGELIRAE